MGNFKKFLNETLEQHEEIMNIVSTLEDDELDRFGWVIFSEFFGADELEGHEDEFELSDIEDMLNSLHGTDALSHVLELLGYSEDDIADLEDGLEEGTSRVFKAANRNKKKRNFMANSKADMRKTKASRKQAARQNKTKNKRYYKANKKKIASYQKSRNKAVKKGTHTVKVRRQT